MNKLFIVGLLTGAVIAGSAWAADTTDKKISQDTRQLKKDYETKVHKDLRKIGAKINGLKRNIRKDGKTTEGDFNKDVDNLEAKKAGVDKKLSELEKSTGDAWKNLRRGVDDAVADLRNSVEKATRQFKEKRKS